MGFLNYGLDRNTGWAKKGATMFDCPHHQNARTICVIFGILKQCIILSTCAKSVAVSTVSL